MTRVATAAENNLTLYYLSLNQSTEQNLNAEISTGATAQTYSQIAPQSAQLEQFRSEAAQQQSFMGTIDTVSTNMQTMSLSLQQVLTQTQSFISTLANDAFNQQQPTVQTQAQTLLQQVAGYLNTEGSNGFLFGGVDTTTPPVVLTSLPQGAAASLTTAVGGAPSSNGYYAGGPNIPPVQIDTQVSVNYGITADNPAFEQIIRVLNFVAQSGSFSQTSATDQANVTLAGQMLTNATQALTGLSGELALQQAQLNTAKTVHQSTLNIAQNGITGILSVNQASAITQLQNLETQIQASYAATSQIQKLTLANYIA
jgi:flagellar hook-associated protein 3 FlgL